MPMWYYREGWVGICKHRIVVIFFEPDSYVDACAAEEILLGDVGDCNPEG